MKRIEGGREKDTYYEVTHVTSSGQEKLKTHLRYQPCETPSYFTNVDWRDITEDDLFCGSGAAWEGGKLKVYFYQMWLPC